MKTAELIEKYIEKTGYGMDMWSKEETEIIQTISELLQSHPSPMSAADMTAREYFDGEGSPLTLSKICNDEEKEFLLQHIELYASGKVHQSKQPPMSAEQRTNAMDVLKKHLKVDWIFSGDSGKAIIDAMEEWKRTPVITDAEQKYIDAVKNKSCAICGYFCNNVHHYNNWYDVSPESPMSAEHRQKYSNQVQKEAWIDGYNYGCSRYSNVIPMRAEELAEKYASVYYSKDDHEYNEITDLGMWEKLVKAYKEGAAIATTPSVKADGWVSVEDGLPEIPPPYYDKDNEVHKPIQVEVWCFDGSEVYEDWFYFNSKPVGCTHWKYKEAIPSPPKQK
jgi:hypothetical protein